MLCPTELRGSLNSEIGLTPGTIVGRRRSPVHIPAGLSDEQLGKPTLPAADYRPIHGVYL